LTEIGNAQHKANGIENIGFTRSIQTGNGIKVGIETEKYSIAAAETTAEGGRKMKHYINGRDKKDKKVTG
jgi:hypothetical protein